MINFDKSNVVFSYNTGAEDMLRVCKRLQFKEAENPDNYLGMTMCVEKSRFEFFGLLNEKIEHKYRDGAINNC